MKTTLRLMLFAVGLLSVGCSHTRSASSSSANPAPDLTLTGFDDDANGRVERSEFEEHVTEIFDVLDLDHNGTLETRELVYAPAWVRNADADQDGKVTIFEFMAGADQAYEAASEKGSRGKTKKDRGLTAVQFETIELSKKP